MLDALQVRDKLTNNIAHCFFMGYVFCLILVTIALIGDKVPSRGWITVFAVAAAFVCYFFRTVFEIRSDGLRACLMLKNILEFILPCFYGILVFAYFNAIEINEHERSLVSPSKNANLWKQVETIMNYAIGFAAAILAILAAWKKCYYRFDCIPELKIRMIKIAEMWDEIHLKDMRVTEEEDAEAAPPQPPPNEVEVADA